MAGCPNIHCPLPYWDTLWPLSGHTADQDRGLISLPLLQPVECERKPYGRPALGVGCPIFSFPLSTS